MILGYVLYLARKLVRILEEIELTRLSSCFLETLKGLNDGAKHRHAAF